MRVKKWAVGSVLNGQTFAEITKRVFDTYGAAQRYVDSLNESRKYSTVILVDNATFYRFTDA